MGNNDGEVIAPDLDGDGKSVLAIPKKRGKMVKTSAEGRSARGDLRSVEDLEPDQPAAVPEVMCDLCDASARSAG